MVEAQPPPPLLLPGPTQPAGATRLEATIQPRKPVLREVIAARLPAGFSGACGRPVKPQPVGLVLAKVDQLPADPTDEAWKAVPAYEAELLLQDMVDPRLAEPSVKTVRVQAAADGSRIAFRPRWDDPTEDDRSLMDAFADACAVQMPATIGPEIPSPQMGEPGRPVEITYWNAAWQVQAGGRAPTLRSAYPNATVDHYPFTAPSLQPGSAPQRAMARRYSPAQAVGNPVAPPHAEAVQDLLADTMPQPSEQVGAPPDSSS